MALDFHYMKEPEEEGALRVPYLPEFNDERQNRGFIDLRGKPELARDIAEAETSPALQRLLEELADEGSGFITIGCDTGEGEHGPSQWHAGGYVQVAFADPRYAVTPGAHKIHATQLHSRLLAVSEGHNWRVNAILGLVGMQDIGGPPLCYALTIEHAAEGASPVEARASDEALLNEIAEFFIGGPLGR